MTDAHVVLGHITAARMSGGVTLDALAARRAVEALAARLNTPSERVAGAVVATVDAGMARALRRVSVERGIDPRGCVLVAFGGGGPLHACGLAERVGVERVLVPPFAGVLSALGLALAPERREAMASVMQSLDAIDPARLRALLHTLRPPTEDTSEGQTQWWLRTRYAGQGHELDVPVNPADPPARLRARFAELHAGRFGFTLERPIEIVSARCAVIGAGRPLRLAPDGPPADRLVRGPATVTLPDATLLVRRGWAAGGLEVGGWLLEREG